MNSNSNYSNSIIKKSKSVPKYDNIKSKKDEYRKKFNRKSKFVDKIIMNLKLRADTSENGSKYGSNST